MTGRQFAVASLFSLALLVGSGSAFSAPADGLSFCKADVARLCPGVQPGGGRIIGCLKQHKMEVSVGCAKALKKMKAEMGK
jgi:Cysteine rich repeat